MQILPAIDLRGEPGRPLATGRLRPRNRVRRPGRDGRTLGQRTGAERLHLVDLDGAKPAVP